MEWDRGTVIFILFIYIGIPVIIIGFLVIGAILLWKNDKGKNRKK